MNILIVGLGEVGSYLAKVLSTEGHSITVIDPDRDRIRRVADLLDVQAVHGDGAARHLPTPPSRHSHTQAISPRYTHVGIHDGEGRRGAGR